MADHLDSAESSFQAAEGSFNSAYNTTIGRKSLDQIDWTALTRALQRQASGLAQLSRAMSEMDAKLDAIKRKLGIA
jgi:hypothetical protein